MRGEVGKEEMVKGEAEGSEEEEAEGVEVEEAEGVEEERHSEPPQSQAKPTE